MPWISSSGDDTMVEQTVPSTTVDPSSGTRATPSASSSDANKVIDASSHSCEACPQVWHQGSCSEKSSYVSFSKLVAIRSDFDSSSF